MQAFRSSIWKREVLTRVSLSLSFSLFFFFFGHAACGILVPQPGIEPAPPAVEAWSSNYWTAREVPGVFLVRTSKPIFIFRISEATKLLLAATFCFVSLSLHCLRTGECLEIINTSFFCTTGRILASQAVAVLIAWNSNFCLLRPSSNCWHLCSDSVSLKSVSLLLSLFGCTIQEPTYALRGKQHRMWLTLITFPYISNLRSSSCDCLDNSPVPKQICFSPAFLAVFNESFFFFPATN